MGGVGSSPKRDVSRAEAQPSPSTQGNNSGASSETAPDVSPSQAVSQESVVSGAPRPAQDQCEDESRQCANPSHSSHPSLENNSTVIQDVVAHAPLEQSGQPGKFDAAMSGTVTSATVEHVGTQPEAAHLRSSQGSTASVQEGHVKLNNRPQSTINQMDTNISADGDPGQTSQSSQENNSSTLQDVQEPGPIARDLVSSEVQQPNVAPGQEREDVNTDDKAGQAAPSSQGEGSTSDTPKMLEDGKVHDQFEKPAESEQFANMPSAPVTLPMPEKAINPNLPAHSTESGQLATDGTVPHAPQAVEDAELGERPGQPAQSSQSVAESSAPGASCEPESAKNSELSVQPAQSDAAAGSAVIAPQVLEDANVDDQTGQPGQSEAGAGESNPLDAPALGDVHDQPDIVNLAPVPQGEIAHTEEPHDDHAQGNGVQPNGLGSQEQGEAVPGVDAQGEDAPEEEAQDQDAQGDGDEDAGALGDDEQDDDAQSQGNASDDSNASSAPPELTDAEILYNLARRLYYGEDNMEADPVRATDLYMWAVEDFQHVPSMLAVAEECVHSEPDKAVTLYERAIEVGDVIAMGRLAGLLEGHYDGIDRNMKRAVELYTRAVDEGNCTLSMMSLADILLDGAGDEIEADPEKAVQLYSRVIDEDVNVDCMLTLARILETGNGPVAADPVRSVELCNRAIEDANHYESMYYLAGLLQRGAEGVEADPERSVTLYTTLIEDAGDSEPEAMLLLANLLLKGCGAVAPNPVRSGELLQTAVDSGYPDAMHTFAALLEEGEGELKEDPKRAVELYEQAIESHVHIPSMHSLANMLRRGGDVVAANHPRAVELYERAIEEGEHFDSMFELGRMYEIGGDEIDVDLARAAELYEKAVTEGGHIKSMVSLSSLLQRGQDGIPTDPKRAFDLLIRAVDEGQSSDAIVALALLLEERRLSS